MQNLMNLFLIGGACLMGTSVASAFEQRKTSSGAGYHWEGNCVTVYANLENLGDEAEDYIAAFKSSIATWSDVSCSSVILQYGGQTDQFPAKFVEEDPPLNIISYRDRKWPYKSGVVAFTAITVDGKTGKVVDSDIELNGEDFEFTTDPGKEKWKMDVQSVVTHELGHLLGLDHVDDASATMFTEVKPGDTKVRSLELDDIEGLCSIYPNAEGATCAKVVPKDIWVSDSEDAGGGCSLSLYTSDPRTLLLIFLIIACWVILRRSVA